MPQAANKIRSVEQIREASDMILRASENWAERYKNDPKTFKALVRMETRLETDVRSYFRGLKERTHGYIDWAEVAGRQQLTASVLFDDQVSVEEGLLFQVVFEDIGKVITIGAKAGEKLHGIDLGIDKYHAAVQKAAKTQTAELVKNVTNTTRDRIRTAVERGIDMGAETGDIAAMVNEAVGSAERAAMIARTESVNGYTKGIITFGKESGAVSKTWELSFDPCDICDAIGTVTVGIDEDFPGDGGDGPPAHPNCRCGVRLNYATPEDPSGGLDEE